MSPDQQKTLLDQVHAALDAIHKQLATPPPAVLANVTNLRNAVVAIGELKQQVEQEPALIAKAVEEAGGR